MREMVLNTNTLPKQLFELIRTEWVKVNETNGVISLTPIKEKEGNCPLLGLAADSSLTVDSFLAMTHDEKDKDGIVQLMPIKENTDCTIGLRGILAGYDDMSVDKFLERKRADKELDL